MLVLASSHRRYAQPPFLLLLLEVLMNLTHVLRSRLGYGPGLVRREFLGKTVTTRYGTIHDRPDYDYGWAYALIHRSTVFFDVGCNVGLETLMACVDWPDRWVLAIDANPMALAVAAAAGRWC